MLIVRDWR